MMFDSVLQEPLEEPHQIKHLTPLSEILQVCLVISNIIAISIHT